MVATLRRASAPQIRCHQNVHQSRELVDGGALSWSHIGFTVSRHTGPPPLDIHGASRRRQGNTNGRATGSPLLQRGVDSDEQLLESFECSGAQRGDCAGPVREQPVRRVVVVEVAGGPSDAGEDAVLTLTET